MKIRTHFVSLIIVVVLAMLTAPAMAVPTLIDGDLDDWGLTKLKTIGNWVTPDSWIPNAPAYYKVEDNQDPQYGGSYTGVHIQGPPQTTYEEPKIQNENEAWVIQPYGGEYCDIEALYFDRDPTIGTGNVYIAVIASYGSINPSGKMGDIRIVLEGREYGIVVLTRDGLTAGQVYKDPQWIPAEVISGDGYITCPYDFYRINPTNPGTLKGAASIAVADNKLPQDKGYINRVIEIGAQKSLLDIGSSAEIGNLLLTMWCSNDRIELEKVTFEIPEFSTIALPALSLVALFAFFSHRKKKEN